MKDVKAKVLYNDRIKGRYFRIGLDCGWSAFDPGQFVMVRIPGKKVFIRRPFSIAHAEGGGGIQLIYKVVGCGTVGLSILRRGDSVDVLGPLGRGFSIPEGLGHAIVVAGGFGIAPFMGFATILSYKSITTDIYYGGRGADDIILLEELQERGARCHVSTEDGSIGHKGIVTELLEKDIDNYLKDNDIAHEQCAMRNVHNAQRITIYCCGPRGLSDAIIGLSRRHEIPAQLSYETYMGCGIGVCLGCAVPTKEGYKRACKEGPVFNAEELV